MQQAKKLFCFATAYQAHQTQASQHQSVCIRLWYWCNWIDVEANIEVIVVLSIVAGGDFCDAV